MLERNNLQEEKGDLPKIPYVIQAAIDSLSYAKNSLERVRENLKTASEIKSQFYSPEVLNDRVKQVSVVSAHALLKDLDRESKAVTQEIEATQDTCTKYFTLQDQINLRNKSLVDALRRAAVEFCNHCNDALLVNIKKLASPKPLLFAGQIFSDFVEFEFNDMSELTCIVHKIENYAVMANVEIFNKRLKRVYDEWKRMGSPIEFEKETQIALNCIQQQFAIVSRYISKPELQFSFLKAGLNSSISVSKKNSETEAELNVLSMEFQALTDKYKPVESKKHGYYFSAKDHHPLNKKIKSIEEWIQKGRNLSQIYDNCHEELEKESMDAYDNIFKEVANLKEKLTQVCDDLDAALLDLKNKIENQDKAIGYAAYLRFIQALGNMNVIKLNSYKMTISHKLNDLEINFKAKIHNIKRAEIYTIFSEYEFIMRQALSKASQFTSTRERELLSLEKEKLAGELVETIRLALLSNLPFWRRQIYAGISSQKIQKIKVPTGIANMITRLALEQSSLETLEDLKKIAEERLNAGSVRFCFFNVRIDSTNRFYQVFEALSDIKNLDNAQTIAFKSALSSIEDKRHAKLVIADQKAETPMPSTIERFQIS